MHDLITAQNAAQNNFVDQSPNLVGSAIGEKLVCGKPTGDKAILIFVQEKLPESESDIIIPQSIDSIPIDVIEVGQIVKQEYNTRIRPIRPGFSCSHKQVSAGTIGGFFIDADGERVVLSNNHVLANENEASIGDIIYQPGIYDQKDANLSFNGWSPPAEKAYFAKLKKFNRLNKDNNEHDSAIATIPTEVCADGMIDLNYPFLDREVVGTAAAQINMSVQKCGRTTGYTTGRIIGINGKFTVGYDFGPATFNDCIVMTNMSSGGDSGSLIMNLDMQAVGLLFAGSGKVTLANPIHKVMDAYGLSIWNANKVETNLDSSRWKQTLPAGATITIHDDNMVITAKANQACFIEQNIGRQVSRVGCHIFSGTDSGATWGPGLVLIWNNKSIKVNLRSGGTFGAYFDGTEYTGIGQIKPNTWYDVRINFGKTVTVEAEELFDTIDGNWCKIIELPASLVNNHPHTVRIGKTDMYGGDGSNGELGDYGTSKIANVTVI